METNYLKLIKIKPCNFVMPVVVVSLIDTHRGIGVVQNATFAIDFFLFFAAISLFSVAVSIAITFQRFLRAVQGCLISMVSVMVSET